MARGAPMKNPTASQGAFLWRYRRFLVAVLSTLTSFQLSACKNGHRAASAEAPTEPIRGSGKQREASPQPTAPADVRKAQQAPAPDLFKRGDEVQFELGSELVHAIPEKFTRAALKSQKITLSSVDTDVWLAVDHHAPRRARGPSVVIADLLNEDVELAPGSHWLTAFEWGTAKHARLQLSAFFVEAGPASLPRTPGCLLVTPELTMNGSEAAKELRFLAVPLALGLDRMEYRAEGEGLRSRGEAPPGTEIILESPPAGDVELSVRCFSGSEQVASDEQMVTINPEAPAPESRP